MSAAARIPSLLSIPEADLGGEERNVRSLLRIKGRSWRQSDEDSCYERFAVLHDGAVAVGRQEEWRLQIDPGGLRHTAAARSCLRREHNLVVAHGRCEIAADLEPGEWRTSSAIRLRSVSSSRPLREGIPTPGPISAHPPVAFSDQLIQASPADARVSVGAWNPLRRNRGFWWRPRGCDQRPPNGARRSKRELALARDGFQNQRAYPAASLIS